MRIEYDVKLDFCDVLLKPKRNMLSGRQDVNITREFSFLHSPHKLVGCPVVASNMDGVGSFSMARSLQLRSMFTMIRKHYSLDDWIQNVPSLNLDYTGVSLGTGLLWNKDDIDYKLCRFLVDTYNWKIINIDVANGYQQNFIDFVKRMRDSFPSCVIIAGNVATPEVVEELLISGADVVSIGIGPGSACTTRTVAGVGVPQLSAVIDCGDAAHGVGGHIMSDGGCNQVGDIVKAFAGGADFVMLGGMFAGHIEGEYENIIMDEENDNCFVLFYGMSSKEAFRKHGFRKDGYRTTEGRVVKIKYKNSTVSNLLEDIVGGLTSGCSYIGARRLKDIPKCATFVRVNRTHNEVFQMYEVDN